MRNLQSLLIFILCTGIATAQGLPKSQLYSFSIRTGVDGNFNLTDGRYLTSFNIDGYNNQPYLTNSGKLYYSIRMADQEQNDIYILDLKSNERYRFTTTTESEYSPWVDLTSGKVFCIRVSELGSPKQKLWAYPIDRSNSGLPVWNTLLEVGYFCPVNDSLMAVYTLAGDDGELHLINIDKNNDQMIAEGISRTFKTDQNGDLLFLHRITAETQHLKLYEIHKKTAKVLTRMESSVNDFTYFDGLVWYAMGPKIRIFNPDNGLHHEVADMSDYELHNITRMFLDGNNLIIVNNPTQ